MLRFQDEKITINGFEAMRHPNDKGQCFKVDVIEESVQEIFRHELPSPTLEKLIVNSIEDIDEDLESEIEECVLEIKASQVEGVHKKEELKM